MNLRTSILVTAAALSASTLAPPLAADQTVRCASRNYQYQHCSIPDHGYVRLQRQHSRTDCHQGRNWDYDRRGIWVDEGCDADFLVETRYHTDGHDDHKGEKAVAAAAAIALIAAAAVARSRNDDDHHNSDDEYRHGGHSSYLPSWLRGSFNGYNSRYHANIDMEIEDDGRAYMRVNGERLSGYVNDRHLYVGNAEFRLDRYGDGFTTTEVGNRSNVVHYRRN